jgi:hypothetical protein
MGKSSAPDVPVVVGNQDSEFEIQKPEDQLWACSSGKTKGRRLKKTSLRYSLQLTSVEKPWNEDTIRFSDPSTVP